MVSFRFGPFDHRLFAAFHAAQAEAVPSMGVLLCNPFGQEAARIHRFYRVLGDRLARKGIAALRFDYFGTGESDGDDTDGNLQVWLHDLQLAMDELQARSACRRVAVVGARLGASLALQAFAHKRLQQLVLWEPILDGPGYLKQLARDHVEGISSDYRHRPPPAGHQPHGEVLGFGMSQELIQQIAALHSRPAGGSPAREVTVLARPGDQASDHFVNEARSLGWPVQLELLDIPFDWTSEEAMNTALVPPAAMQAISGMLERAARE